MPAKNPPGKRRKPERVSGIESAKDRRETLDTLVRAFTEPAWMERHLDRSLWRGSIYDPEHTRVAVADGRVVSAVVMAPRTLRFGPVSVPAMTLGPVGTHDKYRRRGYGAATLNDASRYMEDHGVLLAYLQGIGGFYHRFGYFPFMAWSKVKFDREKAKREALPGRLRRMTRGDIPRLRRIYDAANAGRTCSAVRDRALWEWLLTRGVHANLFRGPRVILDARGRACGYLTLEPKGRLRFREIVVRQDERSCRVALGAVAREARRRETREIELPLAWDDALAVFLRQFVAAAFSARSHPTGNGLMKIVDFGALMRRLAPVFTERWRRAGAGGAGVRFALESEIGAVGFTITRGSVRVGEPTGGVRVRLPQRWLPGLVTGYHAPRDVAARKGARVAPELLFALDVLFPAGWPFVHQGDNY